ncbi:hypothetical protein HK105_208762 [Polyrhizophydium stewartii]|uniref:Flavin-containing monooxygenase n=1 Tax=Polyrhizophydium stewartii TaxID=2732419 RepID=A0ABR4MWY5_9FUNG
MPKRVAVLGAGASGLAALKECLAEGLDVVCFDQEPQLGGLWRYVPARDGDDPHSSLYESTVINTSKDMLAFSDFPVPKDWPTFMPHRFVAKYLQMYCEHFQLKKHIKFNRKVLNVVPEMDANGEHTGRWEVTTQRVRRKGPVRMLSPQVRSDTLPRERGRSPPMTGASSAVIKSREPDAPPSPGDADANPARKRSLSPVQVYDPAQGYEPAPPGIDSSFSSLNISSSSSPAKSLAADQQSITQQCIKNYTFDFVIVCTGHHWKPRLPDFEGVENFRGTLVHSHLYRVPYPFKDQRVLVVGAGNSGAEIATEVSHHASQVLLSTRTGTWIVPKTTVFGLPVDHLSSRVMHAIPRPLANFALESLVHLHHGDLSKYGLKPNHSFTQAHPTVNGEILGRIEAGKVVVHPNVARFTSHNMVEFVDGKTAGVDAVIYCTGYKIENPFLDARAILGQEEANSNRVRLYKHIFPINHRNMAFVGMVQPTGSIIPVAEMQARWVARVFSGKADPLPPPAEMRDIVDKDWVEHCKQYIPRERHTIQVEFVTYMDEIAKFVGCVPDLWRLWKTSWLLAAQVTFGPTAAFQYRLEGPNAWEGAPDAIAYACREVDLLKISGLSSLAAAAGVTSAGSSSRSQSPRSRAPQSPQQQSLPSPR